MKEILIAAAILAVYWVLQLWLLPRMGVPT